MKFSAIFFLLLSYVLMESAFAYPTVTFCNAAPGRCHGDKTYSCSGQGYSAKIHIRENGVETTYPNSYTKFNVSFWVKNSTGKIVYGGNDWGSGTLDRYYPPMLVYAFHHNWLWLHTDDSSDMRLHVYGDNDEYWMSCTVYIKQPTF